jgi:hypothetical protein
MREEMSNTLQRKEMFGAEGESRTRDLPITNRLLYH